MRKQSREAWDALTPKIRTALEAATPEHEDRLWVAGILDSIPARYHARLVKGHAENLRIRGRRPANLAMLETGEQFQNPVSLTATAGEIHDAAKQAADVAWSVITQCHNEDGARRALFDLAERYKIEPPHRYDFAKIVNRMTSQHWWRRKLRRQFQKAEAAFIRMGFVHKHAAAYISDEAYSRFESQQRGNARLLSSMEAVNVETGESITLDELAEHSLSNPKNRRAEVMVRVKGIEHHADRMGYRGLFLTITCPSRMHARLSGSGAANPKFDNSTPRHAQGHLQSKVWEPARAKLDRQGIDYFGLRVVEPHHDGTPHWHMLVFVKPEHEVELLAILRSYALRADPDEHGAAEHRFKVEVIDPAKGGAAAYVAKYIAKNLDGEGVGIDHESGDAGYNSAPRAVAWARQWGFRQFQPFGTPSITIWRELRRLRELTPAQEAMFGAVWKAADEGRFADYLSLQADKAARIAPLWQEEESARYRGERSRRVVGLSIPVANGEPVEFITRGARWEIRLRDTETEGENARFSAPWTRVNNCTRPVLRGFPGNASSRDELFTSHLDTTARASRRRPEKEKPLIGVHPIERLRNTDLTGGRIAP